MLVSTRIRPSPLLGLPGEGGFGVAPALLVPPEFWCKPQISELEIALAQLALPR